MSQVELLGHAVTLHLTFWKTTQSSCITLTFPPGRDKSSNVFTFMSTLVTVYFVDCSRPNGREVVARFDLHFPHS